jgi:hypothetical protein
MHTDREGNFRFPLVPIGDYQVAYQGRKYPVSEGFAGKVWIKGHGDLEDFAIEGITTKSPTTDGLKNCVVLRLKTRPTPDGCPVYAPPEASPPGTYIYRREDLEKLPGH